MSDYERLLCAVVNGVYVDTAQAEEVLEAAGVSTIAFAADLDERMTAKAQSRLDEIFDEAKRREWTNDWTPEQNGDE